MQETLISYNTHLGQNCWGCLDERAKERKKIEERRERIGHQESERREGEKNGGQQRVERSEGE